MNDADQPVNVLKTGSFRKTDGEYTLNLLSVQNIDQILALQEAVIAVLPEQEQNFVLKKDRAFFENHFAVGNAVIGILHEGQLIAQSVIVNPTAAHPKTGMTDMALKAKPKKITVLQGVIVHPDYRGNSLISVMIDTWLETARKEKRPHALAEVSLENHHSWSAFLKGGLNIHSIGTDPADGSVLYNVHAVVGAGARQRLKDAFVKKAGRNVICAAEDVEMQKYLLAKGYKGVTFDACQGQIEFHPAKLQLKRPRLG